MISTQGIKFIVLSTLLVATFLFSMLPLKLLSIARHNADASCRRKYKAALSLLSCFAAGVFLATCLLDLFPDVKNSIDSALDRSGIVTTYPLAEFVMTFGLLMVFLIEQIVLNAKETPRPVDPSQRRLLDDNEWNRSYSENYSRSVSSDTSEPGQLPAPPSGDEEEEGEEGRDAPEPRQDPNSHSLVRSFILLLALSLHSVFEGLAIGLQSTTDKVLQIFAAIALHKSILAFSLGLNLAQSKMSLKGIIKSNLLFSVTSPVGIGIGIAVIDFAPDNYIRSIIDGVLQGLACGTFLYVVFLEILPHEFMTKYYYANRLLRNLAVILGYSTVACLLFLAPGSMNQKHDT